MLEYHIAKKADITVVCKDLEPGEDATRFGTVRMNEESRIEEFEEKPMVLIRIRFQQEFMFSAEDN